MRARSEVRASLTKNTTFEKSNTSMKSATITSKGQILIPVQLRRKYGLHAGAKVIISDEGTSIQVAPVTAKSIRSYVGILKGKNLSGALLASRKKDKAKNQ
jgi:AbrB family looped-hinge helix DNA binding protein